MKKESLTVIASSIQNTILIGIPFVSIGDIVFTFRCREGNELKPVTYEDMEILNLTGEELKRIALSNDEKEATLEPIEQTMVKIMSDPSNRPESRPFEDAIEDFSFKISQMWVLTNKKTEYGAGLLLNARIMEELGNKVGDYVVVPSSIHEILLIPVNIMDMEALESMISEINSEEVAPEDRLSGVPYYWDNRKKTLSTAAQHFATVVTKGQA